MEVTSTLKKLKYSMHIFIQQNRGNWLWCAHASPALEATFHGTRYKQVQRKRNPSRICFNQVSSSLAEHLILSQLQAFRAFRAQHCSCQPFRTNPSTQKS
ncbi:hypothetical protein DUNSADRAFT_11781 [Dunaliella salina]|uniref:Encoded protein n=1 Tax=Dunaliella salina TaxID=3046 RepID=A0ABQ7GCL8_DUNSA|nr:hypothetical protein DUNSADRAFT_11781 [Dunaliella salina]|eukprot:KAF5832339.1 hypothetical protein DUNSADRAFT_11781 [Dunaliella salina]